MFSFLFSMDCFYLWVIMLLAGVDGNKEVKFFNHVYFPVSFILFYLVWWVCPTGLKWREGFVFNI